jgi:hypothetical protein
MANFTELTTKKDRTSYIRSALAVNVNWAQHGVLRIFENQTADEQSCEETQDNNGIGFTGSDANILSSFAKQLQRGRSLSSKQMDILFKKMPKYAGQLERVSI